MTTQGELQIASFTELRDAIQDLPPSAKLVALILKHEGTLSQREIATKSHLSENEPYGTVSMSYNKSTSSNREHHCRTPAKRLYTLTVRDSHQDSR